MGPRLEGDAMAKIQGFIHVEQDIPPSPKTLYRIPDGDDTMRRVRIARNRRLVQ